MGWDVCRVKDCKAVRKPGVSLFKVPADANKRKEWEKILQVHLKPSNSVCEKHFSASQIASRAYVEHNGLVLLDIPLQKKRLREGALPNYPNDSSTIDSTDGKQIEPVSVDLPKNEDSSQDHHVAEIPLKREIDLEGALLNYDDEKQIESATPIAVKNEEDCSQDQHVAELPCCRKQLVNGFSNTSPKTGSSSKNHSEELKQSNEHEQKYSVNSQSMPKINAGASLAEHDYQLQIPNEYLLLLEKLWKGEVQVPLDKSWTCYHDQSSETIFYVSHATQKDPNLMNETILVVEKQLKLKKSEIVLVYQNKIQRDPKFLSAIFPTNIEELRCILKKFQGWNICHGSPNARASERLRHVKLRKIVEDEGKLRHVECEKFIENGRVCQKCLSIGRLLDKVIDRMNKKSLSAPKGIVKAEKRGKKAAVEKLIPRSKIKLEKFVNDDGG